jgi:hypothetical protein
MLFMCRGALTITISKQHNTGLRFFIASLTLPKVVQDAWELRKCIIVKHMKSGSCSA